MNSMAPNSQQQANFYQGNPAPLQQKVQQAGQNPQGIPNDLQGALALEDVLKGMQAGNNAKALQGAGVQPTVIEKIRMALAQTLQAQRQPTMPQASAPQGIAQPKPQPPQEAAQGIDSLPSNIHMAAGGIVAFSEGNLVPPSPDAMDLAPSPNDTWVDRQRKADTIREHRRAVDLYNTQLAAQRGPLIAAQNQGSSDAIIGTLKNWFGIDPAPSNLDVRDRRMAQSAASAPAASAPAASAPISDAADVIPQSEIATRNTPRYTPPSPQATRIQNGPSVPSRDAAADNSAVRLGGIHRVAPETLQLMNAKAAAGDTEARSFLPLYYARFPEDAPQPAPQGIATGMTGRPQSMGATTGLTNLEDVVNRGIGTTIESNPIAEATANLDTQRGILGQDADLAARRKRAEAVQSLNTETEGHYNPIRNALEGIMNSDTRGGLGSVMGAAGKGFYAGQDAQDRMRKLNLDTVNDLYDKIDAAKLSGNEAAVRAYTQTLSDLLHAKSTAIAAGANELSRRDTAASNLEARREAIDARRAAAPDQAAKLLEQQMEAASKAVANDPEIKMAEAKSAQLKNNLSTQFNAVKRAAAEAEIDRNVLRVKNKVANFHYGSRGLTPPPDIEDLASAPLSNLPPLQSVAGKYQN